MDEVARHWPFSPIADPWGFGPGLVIALIAVGVADLHERWAIWRAVREIKRNRERRRAAR